MEAQKPSQSPPCKIFELQAEIIRLHKSTPGTPEPLVRAVYRLAAKECGHDPAESPTGPLEAIRCELARLRACVKAEWDGVAADKILADSEKQTAEITRLRADANRFAYIRDCCAQSHSLHMDGTKGYRLRPIYRHRGGSFAEVVDKAIAEAAVEAATSPGGE